MDVNEELEFLRKFKKKSGGGVGGRGVGERGVWWGSGWWGVQGGCERNVGCRG